MLGTEYPTNSLSVVPASSARKPTPEISRPFVKPALTPVTMLAMRVLMRPCMAPARRLSWVVRMLRVLPSWTTSISRGSVLERFPLGPETLISPPATPTVTLSGRAMIFFPIRDMDVSPDCRLPDVADDLAAHVLQPGFLVRHDPPGRRHDGHPEPVEHLGDLLARNVDPPARFAHPLKVLDDALLRVRVLEVDLEDVLLVGVLLHVEPADVAGPFQDLHDLQVHPRELGVHAPELHPVGVTDSRHHIRNRIGHTHKSFSLQSTSST